MMLQLSGFYCKGLGRRVQGVRIQGFFFWALGGLLGSSHERICVDAYVSIPVYVFMPICLDACVPTCLQIMKD